MRATAALLTLLSLGGCVSGGAGGNAGESLDRELARRGLESAKVERPFELSTDAHDWLLETFGERTAPPRRRLQLLLDRMTGENGLGIRYERGHTGTAGEVFESRVGNCLGFMNLFVGFARELELPVYFVAVTGAESFEREGDLIVISDHIAAGYGPPDEMVLLDFAAGPTREYESVSAIADIVAVARHHSNRGAEMLREGRIDEARRWLDLAVELDPEMAPGWVNLGVALRRSGDVKGAEAAYLAALEIDPELASAYHNLAALIRLRGDEQGALALLELTRRLGSRNPFNYVHLGDWSLDAGQPQEARRFYRRALSLAQHAEIYAALGEVELVSGKPGRARRWLRRAQRLELSHPRVEKLAESLAQSLAKVAAGR